MVSRCDHDEHDKVVDDAGVAICYACLRETKKIREEREAILAIIEDTRKTWKDGDGHQMVEVLLARIRARS